MIFYDTIELTIITRIPKPGGVYDTVTTNRTVRGIVTFMDSSQLISQQGGASLVNSRLRIVLSPSGKPIPSKDVTFAWKGFRDMLLEGAIEQHYRRGRLHHYECVAKAF